MHSANQCSLCRTTSAKSLPTALSKDIPLLLPQSSAHDFLNCLSLSIELYSSKNRNIHLMGDFNIDLFKFESCSYSKELLELTQCFSLLPAVDKPTRVYGNSATLIDNIFSNTLENNLVCGNIVTDTTDHFTQVCIVTTKPYTLTTINP